MVHLSRRWNDNDLGLELLAFQLILDEGHQVGEEIVVLQKLDLACRWVFVANVALLQVSVFRVEEWAHQDECVGFLALDILHEVSEGIEGKTVLRRVGSCSHHDLDWLPLLQLLTLVEELVVEKAIWPLDRWLD
jgi:hypothetical protein